MFQAAITSAGKGVWLQISFIPRGTILNGTTRHHKRLMAANTTTWLSEATDHGSGFNSKKSSHLSD